MVDSGSCHFKLVGCCKKQLSPFYRGLAVIPGWKRALIGKPCFRRPGPTCPGMWIGSQGDPSLGNTFRVHLKAAPTGAVAWRFGRVGACGNGIQLPFPLGGRMYGDPGQILFPFLNLQGLANGDGQAAWDLPVPNTTSVCGLKLCLQWYFACRGATGAAGMGMSRGFEFSIVGG